MAPKKTRGKVKSENKLLAWTLCIAIGIIAIYMQVNWMKQETITVQPTQKIPCMHCEGKATILNPEDIPNRMDCPFCFGTGFRYVRQLGREFEICPVCVGIGREAYEPGSLPQECRACKGWGVFKKQYENVKPAREIKPYINEEIPKPAEKTEAPVTTPPASNQPPAEVTIDPSELLRL